MKSLIVIMFIALCSNASAATAYFTGRQEMVQTVTYQMGWKCEYQYAGQYFWRVYMGGCPMSINVQ